MYFSAFPSASCAEHQCPLWEDHDSAAVSEAAAPSTSPRPLFLEELLENETKYEARDHFTLSSITQSTSQSHSWMPAALWGAMEYLGLCGAGSGPSIRAGHPTLQQYPSFSCCTLRSAVSGSWPLGQHVAINAAVRFGLKSCNSQIEPHLAGHRSFKNPTY